MQLEHVDRQIRGAERLRSGCSRSGSSADAGSARDHQSDAGHAGLPGPRADPGDAPAVHAARRGRRARRRRRDASPLRAGSAGDARRRWPSAIRSCAGSWTAWTSSRNCCVAGTRRSAKLVREMWLAKGAQPDEYDSADWGALVAYLDQARAARPGDRGDHGAERAPGPETPGAAPVAGAVAACGQVRSSARCSQTWSRHSPPITWRRAGASARRLRQCSPVSVLCHDRWCDSPAAAGSTGSA